MSDIQNRPRTPPNRPPKGRLIPLPPKRLTPDEINKINNFLSKINVNRRYAQDGVTIQCDKLSLDNLRQEHAEHICTKFKDMWNESDNKSDFLHCALRALDHVVTDEQRKHNSFEKIKKIILDNVNDNLNQSIEEILRNSYSNSITSFLNELLTSIKQRDDKTKG